MPRLLHFGLVDLQLHHRYQPGGAESVNDVRSRIAKTTTVLPPLPKDAFLYSFGHTFAGGYAVGYYSYKWMITATTLGVFLRPRQCAVRLRQITLVLHQGFAVMRVGYGECEPLILVAPPKW